MQQGGCTSYRGKQGMTRNTRGTEDVKSSVTCDTVVTKVRPPLLHLTLEGQAVGVRAGEEVKHSCVVVQHVH